MKLNYLRTAAEHHLDSVACRRPLPEKQQHGSFLQSFLLLAALLLTGSSASWGQTSYGKAEINAAPTSATDWQCITDQGNVKAWYKGTSNEGEYLGGVQIDSKWFVKLSAEGFIKIRVAKNTVAIGDILKVEVAKYYDGSSETLLGFKVEGSNSVVQQSVSDRNIYTLSYTLKAGDISNDPDATDYDYIQINRNGQYGFSGCAYHSVELLKVQRYSVTISTKDATSGCDAWFTLGDDETQHRGTVNDIVAGTKVVFHGSDAGADHSLMNGWRTAGTTGSEGWLNWGATYTVNSLDANLNYAAEFWSAYRIFANAENGATATVYTNTSTKENISGRKHHDNITETLYFSTTVPEGYTFDGWYNGSQKISSANPYGYGQYTSQNGTTDLTLTAKFKANALDVSCGYGSDWKLTLGTDYKNWALPPYNVKVGGTTIDASNYTLSYEVVSGPITINGNTVTVNDGAATGDNVAQIRVTATPKAGTFYASFTAGTALLNVDIKPVSGVKITIDKREIRVGEAATIGVTRGTGFTNPVYRWTFGSNAGDFLHLPTLTDGAYVVHQAGGSSNPTFELVGKAPTNSNIDVNLQFSSDNGATEYKGTYGNGITVKPITKPTVTQDGSNVVFTYEQDYGDVDAYLEYRVGSREASAQQTGFGSSDGQYTATDIPAETTIYVKSVVRYKYPAGEGDYIYASSEEVEYTTKKPLTSVEVNGTKREYYVYAPEGITSSESSKVGVVISLHGANNDYDDGRVDFDGIAKQEKDVESKKFVVVYPRGTMHNFPAVGGNVRGWNSYDENNTEDVDFFKAIVKELKKTYTVDDSRIYLAGFSNGGMMAYKAAHQAGDFFAAFASVGGFPVNESHLYHAGAQPTPFVHIHGTNDTMVGLSSYDVNAVIHNMVYRNGAYFYNTGTGDGIVGENSKVTSDCHAATEGGAAYYFYKVQDLGHYYWHDWNNDGTDDISATMWAFFNKSDKAKNVDKSLKFRVNATGFWDIIKNNAVGYLGFDNVNNDKSVFSYGGTTKTEANKNVYHDLQFKGGAHYLKMNIKTEDVGGSEHEDKSKFFMVTLTKTGASTPIFSKRYQAGRGQKDLYINFTALDGYNEYKLSVIKSDANLSVEFNNIEFHSGYCEDEGGKENPTAFYTIDEVVVGDMKPIYQPVYGKTYDGLAKEYIPIADIPANDKVTISDNLGVDKLASSITTDTKGRFANTATSGKAGEDITHKSKNVYIIGTGTINTTNGFNISAQGRAKMPEYLAGTEISFPTHGVLAMQVQGTLDLTFLSYNVNSTDANRRMLKAYYTNDQLDGELKELKSWDFYGTRNEDNANGLQPLNLSIRMQHLGQDGTCKVFVSYEGHQSNGVLVQDDADNDDVWIKGIVVKRPDLKVTIGRTDKLRYTDGDSNNDNCDLTCFGENKPYQWNFGTAGFTNTKKSDLEKKKVNQFDGRTYISGVGPNGEELKDHVLVYSEGLAGNNDKAKVQFDGRPSNGKHKGYEDDATDNNEHIEFTNPTVYTIDANRRDMFPVESNGLKVNVTGSGWFTVAASAPNGPVRMKILSSNNGGTAYTNVLREFVVDNENDADKGQAGYNKETSWKTYRVYLKAHTDKDGTQGFWHGNDKRVTAKKNYNDVVITDPEMMQMSLYVVFDAIGNNYTDPKTQTAATPQLNIHYMQWINELPADYVFQQEEDPRLLNSLQHIKGNGTDEKPDLYWQAGTSLVEKQKTITPSYTDGSGTYDAETYYSAYNSRSYTDREGGETSDRDDISAGLGCTWNVGAMPNTKAHTEENYATYGNTESAYGNFTLLYDMNKAKSDNAEYSDKNHEFAIPVSGSFLRFMPMKNQFISAWIVPQDSVASTIYVLDETGEPIPFCEGAGYGADDDVSKVTQAARERGWVNKADGLTKPEIDGDSYPSIFGATATSNAARIDFAALAGKEYFIVANGDGAISLARLQATDNASRAKVEEISEAVTLTDNADNSSIITNAMSGTGRYASADKAITLKRTFASGKWASLVLPFSMNEKKFEEVFGLGAKCLHFTKVDKETNTIVFTHHFYNMVVAGRPVFVYPTQEVKNPVFTDVTLSAETVTKTNTNGGDFTFQASYDNATISKGDLFMNNQNGTNYWTGTDNSYPGMRSFIKNNNNWDFSTGVSTNIGAKAVFLNFDEMLDEDIATSIDEYVRGEFGENAVVITKSTKAYDLNGRVVADGANISHLPAGIYIVNGKKFIVK